MDCCGLLQGSGRLMELGACPNIVEGRVGSRMGLWEANLGGGTVVSSSGFLYLF